MDITHEIGLCIQERLLIGDMLVTPCLNWKWNSLQTLVNMQSDLIAEGCELSIYLNLDYAVEHCERGLKAVFNHFQESLTMFFKISLILDETNQLNLRLDSCCSAQDVLSTSIVGECLMSACEDKLISTVMKSFLTNGELSIVACV